jgi:LAO/AO transport system kinase
VHAGDVRAVAKAISMVENGDSAVRSVMKDLAPMATGARVIGLTGAPGAGKSTVTSAVVRELRARGERTAVLAVDPTSPFSGGALLGDRVRMQEHATDVGQAEVEIASAADTMAVLVVPGMGDAIQAAKADVLEVADVLVVNKADRPETQRAAAGERDRRRLARARDEVSALALRAVRTRLAVPAELAARVAEGRLGPHEAAEELLASAGF